MSWSPIQKRRGQRSSSLVTDKSNKGRPYGRPSLWWRAKYIGLLNVELDSVDSDLGDVVCVNEAVEHDAYGFL